MKVMRVVLPLVVIATGVAVAKWMIASRPKPEVRPRAEVAPLVRVVKAVRQEVELWVSSQGTVLPGAQVSLAAEVTGRVEWVAPALVAGGFFARGDVLLRIDPRDYELAVIRAEAQLKQAEVRVARERAEAEVALAEWAELGDGEALPLTRREPQVAEATALVAAAEATLEMSRRDLARATVRAPFTGRVRQESVDVGQFVSRGAPIATIYSTDFAELRLPVPLDELAFLDVPIRGRAGAGKGGAEVTLEASLAGSLRQWSGRVVRSEGEIDPKTRMMVLVARVDDPYRRKPTRSSAGGGSVGMTSTPLPIGLFVAAEIRGQTAAGVVPLPRAAVRQGDTVLVVDGSSKLRFRRVEILRSERDRVLVVKGVEDGEQVCVSPLETAVDGMAVRALEVSPADALTGPGDLS